MKKMFMLLTAVFMISRIPAQDMQNRLDQVELMQQFVGTWTSEMIRKDTGRLVVTVVPYGSSMECTVRLTSGGRILNEGKWLWGYNPEYDKYIAAEISTSTPDINLFTYRFILKNVAEKAELADVPDSDPTLLISRFDFKSPDLIIQTVTRNGILMNTFTITRVKN